MRPTFGAWLEKKGHEAFGNRVANVKRVEKFHGDLDEHYDKDKLDVLIALLNYFKDDQRRGRENLTKIPINSKADLRNNLAMYKNAVTLYKEFRDDPGSPKAATERAEYDTTLNSSAITASGTMTVGNLTDRALAELFIFKHEHQ